MANKKHQGYTSPDKAFEDIQDINEVSEKTEEVSEKTLEVDLATELMEADIATNGSATMDTDYELSAKVFIKNNV